ncbi:MAG: hypothetical protein IJZ88_00820 [Clostridia bacterium]|nr:hypothetical protein [Clostridia bacterium]
MKNNAIKILSLLIVLCSVAGLCSCNINQDEEDIKTTNRPVTVSTDITKTVKTTDENVVAVAPKGDEEILKYFNGSLKLFRSTTYDFVKKNTCTLTSCSTGSLASVRGATDSYRNALNNAVGDMAGVSSLESTYFAGDDVTEAFAIKELSAENISEMSATAEGNKVTVEFSIKKDSADGSDAVSILTKDYMTIESFNSKVSQYGASTTGATVKVSNVKLKAVIDYSTRNFVSVEISFNTNFNMGSLDFDYVFGGPVSASTKTTIKYTDFKEN